MKNAFSKIINRAFVLSIVFLLICSTVSILTLLAARNRERWIQHTHIVITNLEQFWSIVKGAETGVRGYVISRDQQTLEFYTNARPSAERLLMRIEHLTADNPQQQKIIPELRKVLEIKFDLLERTVIQVNNRENVTPAVIVQGKGVTDELQRLVNTMMGREQRLLKQREAQWNKVWLLVPLFILLFTIGALVSTYYFWRKLKRAYFEKVKYRRRLQKLAIETSNRVSFIQQAVQEVAGGNYSLQLPEDNPDTIGLLARDLNSMIRSLDYSFIRLNELMAKKDAFIGIAAHELNTPLTSIKGALQIIGKATRNSPDAARIVPIVATADSQISRLTNIVRNLLDVSQIAVGDLNLNLSEFDMSVLLAEAVQDIEEAYTKSDIVIVDDGDCFVEADRSRIKQVLVGLLSNALKYSPEGMQVLIKLTGDPNRIRVLIRDRGIGIPVDKIPFVFDRYFRVEKTSQNYSGLGLGLYIAREIVEQHGGQIGVESIPGESTSFWFTLPVKAAHSGAHAGMLN